MSSYDQTAGELSLSFVRGNDFSSLIDFSIDMTGYTATAAIVSAVTGSEVVPFTVTIPSAGDGQVNIALTDMQTAALARGTYKWQMTWVENQATRTALTGFVEVI